MTESKGQNFWATLPGLVTAIAGMVTAVAILVTTLATLPAFQPTTSSSPTGPALPSGDGASAAPVTDTAASSASSAGAIAATASTGASSSTPPRPILFYAVRTDPAGGADNADLYAIDPSTGTEQRLTDDARPTATRPARPSANGSCSTAVAATGTETSGSSRRTGRSPLTDDARDDGYPAWSPDGSQVAWAAGSAGARDLGHECARRKAPRDAHQRRG